MENDLYNQISDIIENDRNKIAEIDANVFLRIWKNNITKNLMEFAEKYDLGYVSILRGNRIVAIRFWRTKEQELLEEKNEVA